MNIAKSADNLTGHYAVFKKVGNKWQPINNNNPCWRLGAGLLCRKSAKGFLEHIKQGKASIDLNFKRFHNPNGEYKIMKKTWIEI